jgi:hypothetical protein
VEVRSSHLGMVVDPAAIRAVADAVAAGPTLRRA